MEEHGSNPWKVFRLSETERSRSNTIPGSPESFNDEACSNLVESHSLELFGMHRELSERFGNKVWKANNKRTNVWPFSHNVDTEDLNYNLQCNAGSPKTMQIKDGLDNLRIDLKSEEPTEKSENQPTEKSVNQSAEQSASQSTWDNKLQDKLLHDKIQQLKSNYFESQPTYDQELFRTQLKAQLRQICPTFFESQLTEKSKSQPTEKSKSQPTEKSKSQPTEKSVDQTVKQSASQPTCNTLNDKQLYDEIQQLESNLFKEFSQPTCDKELVKTQLKTRLQQLASLKFLKSQPTEKSKSQLTEKSVNQPTEESVNQPTEESVNQQEQKFADFFQNHSLNDRPMKMRFRISDEILARREKNESNITPIKKSKNYRDMMTVPYVSRNFMIDASSPVVSAVDDCEPQTRHSEKPKKNGQSRPNTLKKVEKKFTRFYRYYILLLLSVTFVLFSAWLYEIQETRKHSSDFATAVVELKNRIYGQDQALQDLCEYLQHDVPSSKVITLVGGTGVGKSYTVEIIRKNFPRQYAIRQYFPPIEAVRDSDILPFIYPNLIILENLKERDVQDVIKYLKTRQDTNKDRFVTVLLVFNVDDDSMLRSQFIIRNSFNNANVEAKIFSYQPLSEDALEMCIMDGIIESKLILTKKQFDLVKRNLLINGSGCKGAYRQVQVIGRQK